MRPENDSPVVEVNKRALANRENGRKGGIATAKKHTPEWVRERGRKGGSTTRDMYSCDFFRHINEQRKVKNGWPQGKLRKAAEVVRMAVSQAQLNAQSKRILEGMLQATERG